MVAKVLEQLGFPKHLITCVKDGYEGLRFLKKAQVDLIITDWELLPFGQVRHIVENSVVRSEWGDFPPVNGASFVRCLRRSKYSPAPFVPVIMLTGPTLPNHILYARDAGVNEILMKPLLAEDLAERITEIIENPRDFVTSNSYRGPDRRRKKQPLPEGVPEDRRKHDRKIIRTSG
jgi:CheY-like chemotaxis protein